MDGRALRERIERARKQGVRGVELLWSRETGNELGIHRGRVTPVEVAPREHLEVRLWLEGGRYGGAAGLPDDADALLDAASTRAGSAPEDPHGGPVARQAGTLGGLGVLDRRYDQVTLDDRVEVVTTAERAVRQVDRRLAASGFGYRDRLRVRRFANSRGVLLEETDSTYHTSGTVSVSVHGDEIALTDTVDARTFASIASLPYGTNLARRAVDLLQPAVPLAGPVRVMLPPLPVARLFAALAERFDAEATLFLTRRADGAPAVDPRLHLQDDGTLPGGLRSTSFDDRGVCPIPLTLLKEGRVDGRFVGPSLAHRHDLLPTGHVFGDRNRPTNLLLRSGTRSMNATLADLGQQVLIVDDLPNLERDVDFATGALDTRVHGVVVEGNRPIGAVRNLRLTGDLTAVLGAVVEVCSDTDRIGHVDAPGMILDGLIAG
ncbi:MAG: metallopeptidase TldD-related protein [Myxococcota bacterium]